MRREPTTNRRGGKKGVGKALKITEQNIGFLGLCEKLNEVSQVIPVILYIPVIAGIAVSSANGIELDIACERRRLRASPDLPRPTVWLRPFDTGALYVSRHVN